MISPGQIACRIGLHKWSDNKGGIRVCLRDYCKKPQTYGLTGIMLKIEWERELYAKWHQYADKKPDNTCDWRGCYDEITHRAIRPSGTSIGGFCDEHYPFGEEADQ